MRQSQGGRQQYSSLGDGKYNTEGSNSSTIGDARSNRNEGGSSSKSDPRTSGTPLPLNIDPLAAAAKEDGSSQKGISPHQHNWGKKFDNPSFALGENEEEGVPRGALHQPPWTLSNQSQAAKGAVQPGAILNVSKQGETITRGSMDFHTTASALNRMATRPIQAVHTKALVRHHLQTPKLDYEEDEMEDVIHGEDEENHSVRLGSESEQDLDDSPTKEEEARIAKEQEDAHRFLEEYDTRALEERTEKLFQGG
ncbi:hypothetical protein R1sor_013694 [Riccia sorocarpa]|uniref:Uncharacterized protein n=1 Tax=Riccia sorocarpa TaxID=122646 RepID=A0ABD3HAI4_9MARC